MSKYDSIINMPNHKSKAHPEMSLYDRAAQFSPFAALTGYEASIDEMGRITDSKPDISDEKKEKISIMLNYSKDNNDTEFLISYFIKDSKKDGGSISTIYTKIKQVVEAYGYIILPDKTKIIIEDIIDIKSEMLNLE